MTKRHSPSKTNAIEGELSFESVYAAHVDFLWKQLQRFGVSESDLDDVMQEVMLVIHKKIHTYDPTRPLLPWLYGICLRSASEHRKKAFRKREITTASSTLEELPGEQNPESEFMQKEEEHILSSLLEDLDVEKRSVLVMFELEGLRCEEISKLTGIPTGTVYSRLHHAREELKQAYVFYEKKRELFSKKNFTERSRS